MSWGTRGRISLCWRTMCMWWTNLGCWRSNADGRTQATWRTCTYQWCWLGTGGWGEVRAPTGRQHCIRLYSSWWLAATQRTIFQRWIIGGFLSSLIIRRRRYDSCVIMLLQLYNVFYMLLRDPFTLARSTGAALRCCSAVHRTAQSTRGRNHSARRHRNLNIFGRRRNNLLWKVGNLYSPCLILVALGDNLTKIPSAIFNARTNVRLTSTISFRGNCKNGISAALHAIR